MSKALSVNPKQGKMHFCLEAIRRDEGCSDFLSQPEPISDPSRKSRAAPGGNFFFFGIHPPHLHL